jgi:hypothetical protein
MLCRDCISALATMVILGGNAIAQESSARVITGTVSDSSGSAVSHALVQNSAQNRVYADEAGKFRLVLQQRGELTLLVRRLGYQPVELRIDPQRDTIIGIALSPVPQLFEATVVEAERVSRRLQARGFYERLNDRNKGLGSGTFVTREDIELRRPMRVTQMLEAINGVRVVKAGASVLDWQIVGANRCTMTIYLDGSRISPSLSSGRGAGANPVYIDQVLGPTAAAAIEVYPRGVSAPAQFQVLNGTCGVVVFWSR